jgi:hypothetical protein
MKIVFLLQSMELLDLVVRTCFSVTLREPVRIGHVHGCSTVLVDFLSYFGGCFWTRGTRFEKIFFLIFWVGQGGRGVGVLIYNGQIFGSK